jgi:hypothetical protein
MGVASAILPTANVSPARLNPSWCCLILQPRFRMKKSLLFGRPDCSSLPNFKATVYAVCPLRRFVLIDTHELQFGFLS